MSNIHKRIRFVKLMVHWYQWFQWFYWWICISLSGLRFFSHVTWLGTGQFQWPIGTNGTIGTNGKWCHSNGSIGAKKFTFTPSQNALIIIMNVPRSIRKPRKTSSLLHQVKARYNSYEYSSFYIPITQNKFVFTPSKNALIIIMNIPRSISQPHKTSSLLHQVKTR